MKKVCIDDPHVIFEAVRKPSGHIIVAGNQIADTQKCVHCQYTFPVVRGSGITRGFCRNCMGVTCGQAQCDPCVPWERKLDLMEKGKL